MVNKGNAQGTYQSSSGRVGLAIFPTLSIFFSWKVGHAPSCGQLDALQPAVYAKYTIGGAFEIMASHDTSKDNKEVVNGDVSMHFLECMFFVPALFHWICTLFYTGFL